ncbi:phage protein D [Pantoea anthophila]|nr:phage protein D [Pantoea anthophila]
MARVRADLFPELHANVLGFKPTIDAADWVIRRVNNTIDENGFITGLELEVRITDWDAEENNGDE